MTSVVGRLGIGPILLLASLVRLVTLLFHQSVRPLPQGGADAVAFERNAWLLSEGGRESVATYLSGGGRLLSYLGSFVYDLTGRVPFALGLVMVALGVATVLAVYLAVLEWTEEVRPARAAALIAAVFPQLVLHSALFLRETPVAFLLALAAWLAIRFLKRQSLPALVMFVATVVSAALFHSGAVIAIPGLIIGMVVARPVSGRSRWARSVVNVSAMTLLVGSVYVLDITGWGLDKFGGGLDTALEVFERSELRDPRGGAAYPEWFMVQEGLLVDLWKVPIRLTAFLLAPLLPFMVRTQAHLLGALDAALYLGMFLVVLRHGRSVVTSRVATCILVMMMAVALVYALGVSNFGTGIRHRAKIVPLLIVLASALPALTRAQWSAGAWRRNLFSRQDEGLSVGVHRDPAPWSR